MTSWLQNNLQPALKLIGTIILSIGAIVMLSSAGRLAIWKVEPVTTYEEWCSSTPGANQSTRTLSACIESRKTQETHRHTQNQLEGIVTGLSMVIVGGALVLSTRRKR